MGRQAIFLSDEKPQDLEGYSTYPKNDDELKPSGKSYSMAPGSKASASPIRVFVKRALICTLIVLAMTFTLEFWEPQSSKARPSLRKTMYVAH